LFGRKWELALMARDDYLFSGFDWFSVEQHQKNELKREVEAYNGNQLLNTSVEDLVTYFAEKYSIEVPVLRKEGIVADQREANVDVSGRFDYDTRGAGPHHVSGTTVEIAIPFSGEAQALRIRPTTFSFNPPRAAVDEGGYIVFAITDVRLQADQVRKQIDSFINDVENNLSNLRTNVEGLNSSLPTLARQLINARREKLLANQNLVSSLGFRLKETAQTPQTYTAPNVRRKLKPQRPMASSEAYRPEPRLSDEDYSHILDVIQNMAHVMERSPSAFATMNEETLRTHFLVQLNGHYEGQATGETFNYEGKTDILIRAEGRNIFIGECKFWNGPKKLTETIDQLLSYSSWRDTKTAILLFNRNKDLSKVIESAKAETERHANCKRVLGPKSETCFQYVFAHRDDANREMILTLLIFDVPAA
jgi:hypothetical protein